MLLTEDYSLLCKENKILAKSTSRTEMSLKTLFRNFKALEEILDRQKWKLRYVFSIPRQQQTLRFVKGFFFISSYLGGLCVEREKSTLLSVVNVFQSPCPYPNSPTKIHLLRRGTADKPIFCSSWAGPDCTRGCSVTWANLQSIPQDPAPRMHWCDDILKVWNEIM